MGQDIHTGTWVAIVQRQHLPSAVQRLLDPRTFKHLNVTSLVATAPTVMLIATAPEEFGLPECADTVEAAGLKGPIGGCHLAEQFESVPTHLQSYSSSTVSEACCPPAWTTTDWPLHSE